MKRRTQARLRRGQGGFSLIEVMVAVLVLAFGLLGFALLQTMSVRFVQSANYRTQATNLANDLVELMRAQRGATLAGGDYTKASFKAGSVAVSGACAWPTGTKIGADQNLARWQCQVVKALGDKAAADIQFNKSTGVVSVSISWGDQRWDAKNPDSLTTFGLTTTL
ncbi:type IV pilus modification protein PilV [Stenotrophomonas sp. 24(2023)]|uniref:type IV pilus modification protein PilV n=1 Tax=Stenotrophomonas sp. 24(2023) TaxID=3068324 RepID=UPI0027E17122|nr:type IV pilus modification protein PilV [Stenotrophomonas sp. 24(2023)]WMJ68604.1 type IV pilus modification protein PilV [Stenotrophomonas sp. 24(2023)]